jgi:hypothetical protein
LGRIRNEMEKLVNWFRYYNGEITWFIIGFLVFAGLDDLAHGNDLFAILNFGLAYINYKFYSRN